MTEKEGGIVKKGHENGNFSSQRIWTPSRASPPSWCYRSGVCEVEHQFKTIDVLVNYDTEIHGYIEKMKIKKLKGVKWRPRTSFSGHRWLRSRLMRHQVRRFTSGVWLVSQRPCLLRHFSLPTLPRKVHYVGFFHCI